MQKTLVGCGLDASVPSCHHADDMVATASGELIRYKDALADVRGGFHSTEEERHDADVEAVNEFFNDVDKWVCEYAEHPDNGADLHFIITEIGGDFSRAFGDWLSDRHGTQYGTLRFDEKPILMSMLENLDLDDCEMEYHCSEYARWSGPGCGIFAMADGEVEDQTEVLQHDVLRKLHEEGRLDDVLDDVNSDACISRSAPRVKNEETGHYEYKGRETYGADDDRPDILSYHLPGGAWHWVLTDETMDALYIAAVIETVRGSV